jgi:hypothetical protein
MVARPHPTGDHAELIASERDARHPAMAAWERNRAMGRSLFIWRRGVFGWGIPVALITIAYQIVQEQGFVRRLVMTQQLRTGIAIAVLVFPLCGYLFGRWLWTTGEENYERMARTEGGSQPTERRNAG